MVVAQLRGFKFVLPEYPTSYPIGYIPEIDSEDGAFESLQDVAHYFKYETENEYLKALDKLGKKILKRVRKPK